MLQMVATSGVTTGATTALLVLLASDDHSYSSISFIRRAFLLAIKLATGIEPVTSPLPRVCSTD
jgi:hypothetical protein